MNTWKKGGVREVYLAYRRRKLAAREARKATRAEEKQVADKLAAKALAAEEKALRSIVT